MTTMLTVLACMVALAPLAASAQTAIPVVDLPPVSAKTTTTFGAVLGVHQVADGKVLVNDALRHQLKLLDSTLASVTIVRDSAPGSSTSYGPRATPLISYIGDSSLFADWNARTMLVLDGRGQVARALALPRPQDLSLLSSGYTGIDTTGRLVFRGTRTSGSRRPSGIAFADSIPILRADLDFRHVDTVGQVNRPLIKVITEKSSDGKTSTIYALDPLQTVDDWSVLADGSIALVRGHDYHVDWVRSDDARTSTPKLPFDWKRLTDDDKARLTDSVRTEQNAMLANGYPTAEYWLRSPCAPPPDELVGGSTGRGGGGGRGAADNAPPAGGGNDCSDILLNSAAPVGGPASRPPRPPLADLIRGNPIADYDPPLRAGSTLADADGNLWILPKTSTLSKNGELVYDLVNAEGQLFERVRLPLGRAIVGFGKGGVVFLTSGDLRHGFYLERVTRPRMSPTRK